MVIANCEAVVQAAEDFAAQNGGEYPHDVGSDETPAGDTLIDLLPAGILMTNPFTQANTEPSDGSAATEGQTGYVRVADSGGSTVGYYVTGVGEHISEYVFERLKP